MKRLNIFKPGTHTSSNGTVADFNEDIVRQSAAVYDPAKHEAPIVVGHPRDNLPAYGWVSGLEYDEGTGLEAIPDQVDADFADLVAAGRFKKISASFYTPESPHNPVPGSYYLRHVGFLGAQPPAIKGLRDAAFDEGEDEVVEFMTAYNESTTAGLWRKLREWFIGAHGQEVADQVVPDYAVQDLEAGARNSLEAPAEPSPSFNEPTDGATTMTEDELKAAQEKLDQEKADFTEQTTAIEAAKAELEAREKAIADREAALAGQENADFVDGLVAEGKMLPAQRDGVVAMLNQMDKGQPLEFGEGESATQTTDKGFFMDYLKAQPKVVDYQERAPKDKGEGADMQDPMAISAAIEAERKRVLDTEGRKISFAEAAQNIATAE